MSAVTSAAASAATSAATSARLGVMLTELRLPTMKRLVPEVCVQSDREGWPGHQLVETLLEHEMNEREVRRIERHRIESALSPDKRLSSFDFAAVPCVSKAQVMALAQGHEWLQRGANVLLFGPPGVGKSHLVAGLEACADRCRAPGAVHALLRTCATPAGGPARPAPGA